MMEIVCVIGFYAIVKFLSIRVQLALFAVFEREGEIKCQSPRLSS